MTPLPGLRVELVAPDDRDALEAWFSPIAAADRADWPADPGWSFHERAALLDQPKVRSHVLGVARLDRAVVGCFQVRLELLENLDTADLEVWVDPGWRHRGVGRTLLGAAERVARDGGRTRCVGTTEAPLGSPEAGRRDRFAREAGYEPALAEARRELDLPVSAELLDALDAEAREKSAGYRLVTWSGSCPPEWEAGRVDAAASMSTDVPSGDLEVEPEVWDVARLRELERVVAAMDRVTMAAAAAAVAPDGRLAGFTEIGVPRAAPRVAYQFDTIVLPAHRGHRLGLLLKVANVRALQAREPSTLRVVTTNATSNEPIVRVNDRLGFRLAGTGTVWQKRLE
ncbi:MAG TPA: GNAT family N-acetyltransferase [Acidimicrobiales bacterium]|nr:GNAT family N-acetyltransferase [Acidimicrobiales bacterium]